MLPAAAFIAPISTSEPTCPRPSRVRDLGPNVTARELSARDDYCRPVGVDGTLGGVAKEMRLALPGFAGEKQRATITRPSSALLSNSSSKSMERIPKLVQIVPAVTATAYSSAVVPYYGLVPCTVTGP